MGKLLIAWAINALLVGTACVPPAAIRPVDPPPLSEVIIGTEGLYQPSYADSVVEITILKKDVMGTGSAVIFKKDGNTYYALTCNHVAEGQDAILLANNDLCDVVSLAPALDLAVIRFTTTKRYPCAKFGTPSVDLDLRIVGYRGSERHLRRGSITHFKPQGRVSVAGGMYPGYSGGGVFDINGRLVGITSACLVLGVTPESNLGIAIRGDVARKYAEGVVNPK